MSSGAAYLHAQVTGQGDALVFLHSGVTDQREWRAVTSALPDSFRPRTYNRRGHGQTRLQRPEAHSAVEDLRAVMDAAGMDRAVLIGSSRGGASGGAGLRAGLNVTRYSWGERGTVCTFRTRQETGWNWRQPASGHGEWAFRWARGRVRPPVAQVMKGRKCRGGPSPLKRLRH